jgi:hypothetical protein
VPDSLQDPRHLWAKPGALARQKWNEKDRKFRKFRKWNGLDLDLDRNGTTLMLLHELHELHELP